MCAVATSAALFDQIVQAPSPICARIIAIQINDQNRITRAPCLAFHKNASTVGSDQNSQHPMRHLNPDLRGCRFHLAGCKPLRVDLLHGGSAGVRQQSPIGEGKIRNGQTKVFVAHGGSKGELQKDQRCGTQSPPAQGRVRLIVGPSLFHKTTSRHHRQEGDRDEEGLSQECMKYPDHILDEDDPQSAKEPLQAHPKNSANPKDHHPASRLNSPKPNRQHHRHQADQGGKKAMRVFVKDSADPSRDRKQKHVVSKAVWPIWDGHSRTMRSDKTAAAKENKGQNGSENRPPMHCRARSRPGIAHRATSAPPASRDRGPSPSGAENPYSDPAHCTRKGRGKR